MFDEIKDKMEKQDATIAKVWLDERYPFGEARHLYQRSLALAMLPNFARKGLGGGDMEMNLIPGTVSFDANQRLEISSETNQRYCLGHHQ
ncbi:hypothetical protein SLEP1_g22283 [Rubroshorea leprosula]|uniref:Uncharacterized protein n=1 Tax=Rubroshorea leprosula TaxID=152421 RepID=A0AAV5JHZ7_9ROSI|nr:hypothetical protein SLEP1_g22283 [Rubroshorea leprosula]